jgi:hypothetical protein
VPAGTSLPRLFAAKTAISNKERTMEERKDQQQHQPGEQQKLQTGVISQ